MGEQESLNPHLPSTDVHDTDQEKELVEVTKSAAAENVSNIRNYYVTLTGPLTTSFYPSYRK